jgi:hypothetical protein
MPTQTELEFRSEKGGQTQNEKLRAYFEARPKQWLSMTDLGRAVNAWAVHSRVSDLRKRGGMCIWNRTALVDGQRHSFYDPDPDPTKPVPELNA